MALCASNVLADRHEITFPVDDGIVDSQRTNLAFAHGGQIGLSIVINQSARSAKLFSFSVAEAKLISEVSLTPDFSPVDSTGRPQAILLNVHSNTGLVIVSGQDSNRIQKLMAFSADKDGLFSKLWISSFTPSSFSQIFNISFNRDGSRVYFIYNSDVEQDILFGEEQGFMRIKRSEIPGNSISTIAQNKGWFGSYSSAPVMTFSSFRQQLALIRTVDGVTIDTTDLSINEESAVLFNEARNQAIVLTHGMALVFAPKSDSLELESQVTPPAGVGSVVGQGFSHNGRFLIGYAGISIGDTKKARNEYVSYDLEQKTSHYLSVENTHSPIANGLILHPATQTIFVPLSIKVKPTPDGSFRFIHSGSRMIDIISLIADGSLARIGQVKIPNHSPGSPNPNRILGQTSSVSISATGALGFLSSQNGYLFTFDTFTGDIINDELIDSQTISSIHLLESIGLVVTANGTNKLLLVSVSTGPVVKRVQIKNGRTIIKGANFLSGARLEINGVEVDPVNRNPDNPGRELIIERGKNDFQKGESYEFVVINRDGLKSRPFTLTR
jgi:hypothetical protein